MPELPEVETICRALRPCLLDNRVEGVVAHVDSLRHSLDMEGIRTACAGRRITDVRRRGKYLVVEFSGARALVLHLGMTGSFRIEEPGAPERVHDRVCWTLANGRRWIFADVRRFGILVPVELCGPGATPELLSGLGPEPLGPEFTAGYLHGLSRGRSKPVKNLLLDQRTVAGLGNIYVNETLFLARVHPARPAGRLSQGDCEQIVRSVRQVLGDAIDAGGTTISDYRTVDGSEGRFAIQLCVYGRAGEPCPRCGIEARVNRQVLGGRSTFWCPVCQR